MIMSTDEDQVEISSTLSTLLKVSASRKARCVSKLSLSTRLHHDLRYYGDIAEDFLRDLASLGVNVSWVADRFGEYFTSEWGEGNALVAMFTEAFRDPIDLSKKPIDIHDVEKSLSTKVLLPKVR